MRWESHEWFQNCMLKIIHTLIYVEKERLSVKEKYQIVAYKYFNRFDEIMKAQET